jgi:hypothetical protein
MKMKHISLTPNKILLIVVGIIFAGTGLVFLQYCFPGKPEAVKLPKELQSVAEMVIQPQNLSGQEQQSAVKTMSSAPPNVRNSVIEAVTRQSIEVLRDNFKGLKTQKQKQQKVREIVADIDCNYIISEDSRKIFSKEFIANAMNVYMKEVSAEERSLFDPIVRKFIQKMNSGGK